MKTIEVDDELYHYIASRTQAIGESASDILRRLLRLPASPQPFVLVQENMINELKDLAKLPKQKKQLHQQDKVIKQVEFVLASSLFNNETKGVNRFLYLLSALYKADPESFSHATENVQGSERIYFARDEQTILATGSSVKAKQIPESPFWVITNNNTERKGIILCALMNAMELPEELVARIKAQFN
ncbi:replication initiation negative regulator SeqA [Glaesserella parasuis]|uniref:Negative modulator of initiation of replication n=1 Tax=Glaesserella parasuis serovar 5 (strain SH0165) TaxID=557723 RepID=SEQA_GLAP5|nr:replication initiation negative regulator SeqA [Glaesserella parasuis]B8F412.1 RecName: Full=Negative modulator of initiation of replication [Glaesserella parasuis SH0165]ACL32064.1 negative replication initiation regulator SeqA [Glaesserella parasuis SH0165]EMY45945.1 replication initiation regulator SeqA [Glaesserella parasuis gx033]MCT8832705.1 replication initiation negative regulator SeqA [Glaesserella parasuis]MCT8839390.1 replication initiation negative regulator SeqA [Glaesserella p